MKTISDYNKEYHAANKEKISARKREYYLRNREKKLSYRKEYYENNKQIINDKDRIYKAAKYRSDADFKILSCLRTRLTKALKGRQKTNNTVKLIGCSILELRQYLENKFLLGMTWGNHGDWHIDHIKPCSKFDMTKSEEQVKCFHFTNLQPLWAVDNLKKGNK